MTCNMISEPRSSRRTPLSGPAWRYCLAQVLEKEKLKLTKNAFLEQWRSSIWHTCVPSGSSMRVKRNFDSTAFQGIQGVQLQPEK